MTSPTAPRQCRPVRTDRAARNTDIPSVPPLPILVVLERESYWLAECQRQLAGQADVRASAVGEEVFNGIDGVRPALVILEAEALRTSLPHVIARLCRVTRVIAVVPEGGESGEWWLRELGADAVYREDHPRDEVLETCRRLLRAAPP